MRKAYRHINGVKFIDLYELWKAVEGITPRDRLRVLMEAGGVRFFDPKTKYFVMQPSVGIGGIGGIPIHWKNTAEQNTIQLGPSTFPIEPEEIAGTMVEMMGFGGFCSYLNPKDQTPLELFKRMINQGHYSTGHMVTINIMVLGVSTAVENEFNSQRDLIHFTRFTESRTAAQKLPSCAVLYPELLPLFKAVFTYTKRHSEKYDILAHMLTMQDYLEARNLIFPAAKATAFILTANLRNLQKLTALLADSGKEEEFKRVVAMLNDSLIALWPTLFKKTTQWGYTYPMHFSQNTVGVH